MSLDVCIPDLLQKGELTPQRAARIKSLYDDLVETYRRDMSETAAAALATEKTLEQLTYEAALRRRRVQLQASAQAKALENMRRFNNGSAAEGPIDPRAAEALLTSDSRAPYSNVEYRIKAVRARAHAQMDEVLARFKTGLTGVSGNRAELAEVTRELFGEATGNANARELAKAFSETAESLRQRFNAAGGDIGKLENWGLPQAHDTLAVRRAGFDAWYAEIAPRLDRVKMQDATTGLPFTPQRFLEAMRDVYDSIRTDGWDDRTPGGAGTASLARRRADSRFLIFKSADDWMAYQERFGTGTPFDAMMGHIDGMAKDIALMEVLGPNPNATVRFIKDNLIQTAQIDGSPGSKAIEKAAAGAKRFDRLYSELATGGGQPESRKLALFFSSLRSFQAAAKLGGAFLSALPTDPAFQMAARKFNGLPVAGLMGDYIRLFKPGALEDQKLAVRMGLIAEEWSKRAAAQHRLLGEELTGEVSRRLAEGVLRVSGLQRWTQAGRWAFGMEFLGHLGDNVNKRLDELHPLLRNTFRRYGISARDWDEIRATPLETDRGAEWLKPSNIKNRELGDRLLEMVLTETNTAVPEPDLKTRALINSVAPKGTWTGEAIRSAFLFKSFGITVMVQQMRRMIELSSVSPWAAGRYAAGFIIATTIGGAAALQLKSIAAGKDPRDMNSPEFWGASAVQGGGFGIFGDFLQSAQNRHGQSIGDTILGPVFADTKDLIGAAQSKHPAWRLTKEARDALPGGSLWYLRLAMDREISDQIQQQIDPDYRQSWSRMKKFAKEQRTQYWWAPGDQAPSRAPDFANAAGQNP